MTYPIADCRDQRAPGRHRIASGGSVATAFGKCATTSIRSSVKAVTEVLGFCGFSCGILPTRIQVNRGLICMKPAGIFHTSQLKIRVN